MDRSLDIKRSTPTDDQRCPTARSSLVDLVTCPITLQPIKAPVVCSGSGITYEFRAIWRALGTKPMCPVTGILVHRHALIPNRAMESLIDKIQPLKGAVKARRYRDACLKGFRIDINTAAAINWGVRECNSGIRCINAALGRLQRMQCAALELQCWCRRHWSREIISASVVPETSAEVRRFAATDVQQQLGWMADLTDRTIRCIAECTREGKRMMSRIRDFHRSLRRVPSDHVDAWEYTISIATRATRMTLCAHDFPDTLDMAMVMIGQRHARITQQARRWWGLLLKIQS